MPGSPPRRASIERAISAGPSWSPVSNANACAHSARSSRSASPAARIAPSAGDTVVTAAVAYIRMDLASRVAAPVALAQRAANSSASGTGPFTPGTSGPSRTTVATSSSSAAPSRPATSRWKGGVIMAHATTRPASSTSHR